MFSRLKADNINSRKNSAFSFVCCCHPWLVFSDFMVLFPRVNNVSCHSLIYNIFTVNSTLVVDIKTVQTRETLFSAKDIFADLQPGRPDP